LAFPVSVSSRIRRLDMLFQFRLELRIRLCWLVLV